jgi:hypothetical protein
MKHIPLLLVVGFALSLCNLSSKLMKKSGSGTETSTSSDSGGTIADRAEPTAAQTAALAGGQQIKWDPQGMSWSVPPKWTESSNETKELVWRSQGSGDAASLIVSISTMNETFPTNESIKAYYESGKDRMKNGEVDELKWLEIDGVKGVELRESNPEKPDDIRRLQWLAYRKFAGQVQFVNVMLATSGKDFPRHQDEMYGILYSTKLVH